MDFKILTQKSDIVIPRSQEVIPSFVTKCGSIAVQRGGQREVTDSRRVQPATISNQATSTDNREG